MMVGCREAGKDEPEVDGDAVLASDWMERRLALTGFFSAKRLVSAFVGVRPAVGEGRDRGEVFGGVVVGSVDGMVWEERCCDGHLEQHWQHQSLYEYY